MPAAVWKNRRRDRPWRLARRSLISISRASTSFCCAVCGTGRYSSLDTICVGTGEGKDAVSAGSNPLINPSSRNFIAPSRWRLLPPSLSTMAAFGQTLLVAHGTEGQSAPQSNLRGHSQDPSLNNRIGWWSAPSCRRGSASTCYLAVMSKTWMTWPSGDRSNPWCAIRATETAGGWPIRHRGHRGPQRAQRRFQRAPRKALCLPSLRALWTSAISVWAEQLSSVGFLTEPKSAPGQPGHLVKTSVQTY